MDNKLQKCVYVAYGAIGTSCLWAMTHAGPAIAQVNGSLPSFLKLQATTPGTAQTGNSNITGTSRAGQFIGGGAGVTGVNADLLDGLDSSAFLTGVPNPLTLAGSQSASAVITGTNSSTGTDSSGIKGVSSAISGTTNGVWGTTSSSGGRGVFGEATATSGLSFGGRFENSSTLGRAVYGLATASSGNAYGVFGQSASSSGRGIFGSASATAGTTYGGYFDSNSVDGYGVLANSAGLYGLFASTTQTSGTAYGVYGQTAAFNGVGVYGDSTSTSGANYGGRFKAASTGGVGVLGSAIAATGSTMGGRFEVNSTSGRGVFGYATALSGTTYGVYGLADSPSGRGVYGKSGAGVAGYFLADTGEAVHAESDGPVAGTFISTYTGINQARGVVGQSSYSGGEFTGGIYGVRGSGGSYGVDGFASNSGGHGVTGFATGADSLGILGSAETGVAGWSGSYRGVWGDAFNNGGGTVYGIYGEARTNPGRGVYGLASNSSGTGYGVRGVNTVAAGYGVYAAGDLGASGLKSFAIDHPFDPLNKYLKHYCAEGPEPKNIYDGSVVTDASGWATIVLPDYFMEINKDPRVQLTVVDSSEDFVMVKRVGEFSGNTFRIRTSKGHVKVDWEVKATRNDAWVRVHGAPVEVAKDATEKGKYQHPELYGKPKEMGIDYDVRAERGLATRNNSPKR